MQTAIQRIQDWKEGVLNLNCLGLQSFDSLPPLPYGITKLCCVNNLLTALPRLPANLKELWCSSNLIAELPPLPSTLEFLSVSDNRLSTLPDLPDGLKWLGTPKNFLPVIDHANESMEEFIIKMRESLSRDRIRKRCRIIQEELMMVVWHPKRVEKLMLLGIDMEDM